MKKYQLLRGMVSIHNLLKYELFQKFLKSNKFFALVNIFLNLIFQILIIYLLDVDEADDYFIILMISFWIITLYQCFFESILSESLYIKNEVYNLKQYFFLIILLTLFILVIFINYFAFDFFLMCAFGCFRGLQSFLNYLSICYKKIILFYKYEILFYIGCIFLIIMSPDKFWIFILFFQMLIILFFYKQIFEMDEIVDKGDNVFNIKKLFKFVRFIIKRSMLLKIGSLIYNSKDFLIINTLEQTSGLISMYNLCLRLLSGFYRGIIHPYFLSLQSDIYNNDDYSYHTVETNKNILYFFVYVIFIIISACIINYFTSYFIEYNIEQIIVLILTLFLYYLIQIKFYIYFFKLTAIRKDYVVLTSNFLFVISFYLLVITIPDYILSSLVISQFLMSYFQYVYIKKFI